ncbi:MAG: rubrerythrin [Epulopiscium sp.]|uniref:Rubrerythrin family protein n=1 Tax=Defluviitalea raffinosedens TaxID=1450156 RepID=A0A7C8LCH4_9FIRM|nr:ferritin family protein [Defluviitalea raffinosedens]MBZ4668885.1 rubrerythrin family protein [Defluviitaleaceae bacterium]MDK2787078.1 rubrerythrin [Candidatus Epulonipiscium sp.]KAE9634421.1 rubrerythrin family protein [Defluviitalea raffinosedens]MBM7684786.1 rubrerythrin [Defluviitalea raffinosedens]HHW67022.1 rubrerythrin family protein [Candidatus Epulonipiscium sp.]
MEIKEGLFENMIGETKGTALERTVKQNFQGETSEVGMYLAMARLAQRQGYGEIAEVLKTIAWEEAEHAARFAEFNGLIQEDIFDNIKQMLEGEIFANQSKKEAGDKAKELGLDSAMYYFYESARDEARHARILEGILKRCNK